MRQRKVGRTIGWKGWLDDNAPLMALAVVGGQWAIGLGGMCGVCRRIVALSGPHARAVGQTATTNAGRLCVHERGLGAGCGRRVGSSIAVLAA